MQQSPLVSIIMRAYNARRYIMEALESALAQTYRPIEIIVVDDGSTDGTQELLAPLIAEGKIRYVRQEHQGPWPAANRGLKEAKGKYIQLLDSDDLLLPEKIERQVRSLEDAGPDMAVAICDYRRFKDESPEELFGGRDDTERPVDLTSFMSLYNFNAFPLGMLYMAEAFRRYGEFDAGLPAAGDWEFWARMVINGVRPVFEPTVLSLHRRHGGNLTSRTLLMVRARWNGVLRAKSLCRQRGWHPYSREQIHEVEEICRYALAQQLLMVNQKGEAWKHLMWTLWFSRHRLQAKVLLLLAIPFMEGNKAMEWATKASDRIWIWRGKAKKILTGR